MSHALAHRLDVATRLATEAGKLALSLAPPPGAASAGMKGPQDWITEAAGAADFGITSSKLKEAVVDQTAAFSICPASLGSGAVAVCRVS